MSDPGPGPGCWDVVGGGGGARQEPLSPRQAPRGKDLLLLSPQCLLQGRAACPSALMEERDFLEAKGR